MDTQDYTVHQLRDYQFKNNASYTLLSARMSGKSFLIRQLVYLLLKRKQIDVIYCFSYTADVDEAYNWLAKEYIIDPKMCTNFINLIFKVQKQNINKRQKVCFIFDDFDITSQNDALDMLYTRGRHYDITTILSCQLTTKSVSPAIRNNSQYTFVRKLNSESIKKGIFSMLLNTNFDKPQAFYEFVKKHNVNYQFILYLNDDRPPEDSIQLIKADDVKFKVAYKVPKSKSAV